MPQIAGVTHDISITVGSTETGFMLARTREKRKAWSVSNVDVIPNGFVTDRPSYANVPGKVALSLEQSDFSGGIGENYFETGKKFNYCAGADASILSGVYNAPQKVKERRPTITNPGAEDGGVGARGAPPTGWTVVAGAPTVEASCAGGALTAFEGINLIRLNPGDTIKQTIEVAPVGADRVFHFSAAIGMINLETCTVTIDCGLGGTRVFTVQNTSGAPAWIERSFSWIIPALATEITVQFAYGAASASTAGVDNLRYSTPTRFCNHGGLTWLARDRFVERWSETLGWDWQETMPADITDLASFGTNLIIAQASGNAYYYGAGSPFTASTLGVSATPQFDADQLGTVGNYLWKNLAATAYWSSNPTNTGVWTLAGLVGSGTGNILHIPEHPLTCFACKPEGLYTVDRTGLVTIYDSALMSDASATFGMGAFQWKGAMYLPCGTITLDELGNVITDISPSVFSPDVSEYRVITKAICGDSTFLYMVGQYQSTPTKMWIFRGRNLTIDGQTQWRWYPIRLITLSSSTINDAIVSQVTPRKMFIATGDGVVYVHVPASYADPLSDTNYLYDIDTDENGLYTAWIHGNYKMWDKAWHNVTILSSSCAVGVNTIVVYFRMTDGGAWTLLGTVDASPVKTLYFPASTYGRKLQIRFDFSSSTTLATPVLLGYLVESKLRPPSRRSFEVRLNLDGVVTMLNGGMPVEQSPVKARDVLWSAFTNSWPVVLRDELNTSYNVDIDDYQEFYDTDVETEEVCRILALKMTEARIA